MNSTCIAGMAASGTSATAAALRSSLAINCSHGSLLCASEATECTSRSCFMYNLLFHCNLLLQRHGLSLSLHVPTHDPTIPGPLFSSPFFQNHSDCCENVRGPIRGPSCCGVQWLGPARLPITD